MKGILFAAVMFILCTIAAVVVLGVDLGLVFAIGILTGIFIGFESGEL